MAATERLDIAHHFAAVDDPRDPRFVTHPLGGLLTVALCATLAGAKSFEDIAAFGRAKLGWLTSLGLDLSAGVPSHDTFRDVFRHLCPGAFQGAFAAWISAACARLGVEQVQVDGKALRGSRRGPGGTCLRLVSAWAGANSLTLGQVAVEEGSNEVEAIPRLLEVLRLNGALVTIDAAGCQKEVARKVLACGGDYLLRVRGNQPRLEADIAAAFEAAAAADFEGVAHDLWLCESEGHGRREERACAVLYDLGGLSTLGEWEGLKAVVQVQRLRRDGARASCEAAYYISSRRGTAEELGSAARAHWGVESMHWVLDVAFREDHSRLRDRAAAENLGLLRRVAVSLLGQDASKGSISGKQFRAACDDEFRLHLLNLLSEKSP